MSLQQRIKGHTLWVHYSSPGDPVNPSWWLMPCCNPSPGLQGEEPGLPVPQSLPPSANHAKLKMCCPVFSGSCMHAVKHQLLLSYLESHSCPTQFPPPLRHPIGSFTLDQSLSKRGIYTILCTFTWSYLSEIQIFEPHPDL